VYTLDSDDLIEPDGPETIGPCLDPGYLIRAVVAEQAGGLNPARIAGRFHRSLATLLVHAAKVICDRRGLDTVALSGGVYQNHYFFELMVSGLESAGLNALTHHKVPCNDGGLALGQAIIAARQARR
jgi:hydrogenase maturation protein HypF